MVREPSDDGEDRGRRRGVLVGVGLVLVLAVAAGAFALLRGDGGGGEATTAATFSPEEAVTSITAPPEVFGPVMQLSVESGRAGSEVTLQGAGFKAGKGFRPVEVYWDKAGGLQLARVEGPQFSVKLRIPADAQVVTEGHNVVALQRDSAGRVISQKSVPFFVVDR